MSVDGDSGSLGRRDRVVLAALTAVRGRALSAEQLADALWGEHPPASWNKVVQGCVVRLRKRLGPRSVLTSPQGYLLTVAADEIDIQRFEHSVSRGRELITLRQPDRAAYVLS